MNSAAINWFESYLTGRIQLFTHDGTGRQTSSFPVDCSVPQGSVLSPVGFIIYWGCRLPDGSTCRAVPRVCCRASNINSLRSRLSHCASDTDVWCRCCRLQLNANKTEAIWFGSKSNLSKLSTANTSVQVGSATFQPSAVVRDLGLHLDSELSMKHHVAKVAAVWIYHLRGLRQIRRRVGTEVTIRLVLAVVISRLDYCNSVLAGVPLATLRPPQRARP